MITSIQADWLPVHHATGNLPSDSNLMGSFIPEFRDHDRFYLLNFLDEYKAYNFIRQRISECFAGRAFFTLGMAYQEALWNLKKCDHEKKEEGEENQEDEEKEEGGKNSEDEEKGR